MRPTEQPRRMQAVRQGGKLVAGLRPEVKRRRELRAKPSRSQAETMELILLNQQCIMEHLGIE